MGHAGASVQGTLRTWGRVDGACSSNHLIPGHGSCPCGERRGFRGDETVEAAAGTGRSVASELMEREEGVRRKERRAWRFRRHA
jgi:hypothetical protein